MSKLNEAELYSPRSRHVHHDDLNRRIRIYVALWRFGYHEIGMGAEGNSGLPFEESRR